MITIEKLSLFNIESFRKLYNDNYQSYICDKDFFTIYDEESFVVKYLLRKQVKLFKAHNKFIGYIWYDESKGDSSSSNIYSIYIMDNYIEYIDNRFLNCLKSDTFKFDVVENDKIMRLMSKLGFGILNKTTLMKLEEYNGFIEVDDEIEFFMI